MATWRVEFAFKLSDGTTMHIERDVEAGDVASTMHRARELVETMEADVPEGRILSVEMTRLEVYEG